MVSALRLVRADDRMVGDFAAALPVFLYSMMGIGVGWPVWGDCLRSEDEASSASCSFWIEFVEPFEASRCVP